ncbi:ATP-binding protein [Nonomuraea sp. KC401]|uniref:ATP-binding protein n=1 Tax=Nonomuraea longispora TaxID=1848320 RepID=A0A4R4NN27_9ACTN|nr:MULTISPECIES: ATP-binding protein [Nonomuraea]NBE95624.1 ATP-binding protein [Nonomuraea sp. K271]TDC10635.1 ATP-binding protein [Nonomuraea longispora]TLF71530.1 ATP-binding protein [Nonomuraea sp. KC401]
MAPPDLHRVDGTEDRDPPAGHDLVARLPGSPSQVSRARSLVTDALGRDHPLHDDVVLLTSELATNAVLHSRSGAGGSFTVTVTRSDTLVRVFVADAGSEGPPCVCRTSAQATSGRGLPLIEALSHRWGFTREDGSTTVWFELLQGRVAAGLAV